MPLQVVTSVTSVTGVTRNIMAEITIEDVRGFLKPYVGQKITLSELRYELKIERADKSFDGVRTIMFRLIEDGTVKTLGRKGEFKVIKRAKPVPVFSIQRERKPPFNLIFPKDFDTGMEFPFADSVVIREGDCILLAGQSNYGKTALAVNFLGEDIDQNPVLLGNEFTSSDEPTPRFLNRLDAMDWVEWIDKDGQDKFTLLPVYEDFAENVIKDRINIIDWINLPGEYYMISPVMEAIKRAVGKGLVVVVLQKNPGLDYARGGNPSKDFADLELLIDRHNSAESRITVGKCKESTALVSGRSWAFGIFKGVKLKNIREVKKCKFCYGKGYTARGTCDNCNGGWVDA